MINILVNDETVSDGEAGCDRAGLIFKCVLENAPKVKNILFIIMLPFLSYLFFLFSYFFYFSLDSN